MAQEIMMVPTTDYNNLVNFYKGKITESTLLQKAGRLAAERRLILANKSIPNSTAIALTKDRGREIRRLTQRIRSGGVRATGAAGVVVDDDDDDNAMLNAPLENTLKTILKQTRTRPTTTPTGMTPSVLTPPSPPPVKKKKKPIPPSPTPQKKKTGGLKEAMKKGLFKSTMKKLGIKKFQTSESEDESDESDETQPKKSRAVQAIKPAPGWEDWAEGKQTRRKLLSEYSEDDDEEEEGAAAYPKKRRKKKNK